MLNAWFPLSDIESPPIDVGGMCEIFCLPVSEIISIPHVNPQVGAILGPIKVTPKTRLLRMKGLDKDNVLIEKSRNSRAGRYYDITFKVFIPEEAPSLNYTIEQLGKTSIVLFLKERNGLMKMIGDVYNGVKLKAIYKSGSEKKQRGYELTFFGKLKSRVKFFFEPILVLPPEYLILNNGSYLVLNNNKKIKVN